MAVLRPASARLRRPGAPRPQSFRLRGLRWVVACAVVASAGAGWAAHGHGEYEVKAAFLLNFARLVEWPSSAFRGRDDPIALGVLGRDPFGGSLEKLVKGRSVGRRLIEVKQLSRPEEAARCHIVFVSAAARTPVREILSATGGANVLLVGEKPDFAQRGGAINFISEDHRVRFEINPDAARRAGLGISSRLLRLAKLVSDDRDPR